MNDKLERGPRVGPLPTAGLDCARLDLEIAARDFLRPPAPGESREQNLKTAAAAFAVAVAKMEVEMKRSGRRPSHMLAHLFPGLVGGGP